MKNTFTHSLCLATVIIAFSGAQLFAAPTVTNTNKKPAPLSFIENKGQVTDQYHNPRNDVQFRLKAANGLNIFVGNGAIHYQFSKADNESAKADNAKKGRGHAQVSYTMDRMDVELVGANMHAEVITEQKQAYFENYYTKGAGKQGAKALAFGKVTYKNIYPNIDWVLYINNGKLEHEFVVRPGGKAGDIKLKYGGAEKLKINNDGSLTATTQLGVITEQAPNTYQAGGQKVNSSFKLNGDVLSYQTGVYTGTLVIDPTLGWATYFGGSGDDLGNSVATDASGNVFMVGFTNSTSAIATTGAYITTMGAGTYAVFLAEFNSAGSILWATYYGGDGDDEGTGVATDPSGNVYITGLTDGVSSLGITATSYQPIFGGSYDAFLAKFDGTGAFTWATYFGGPDYDLGNGIATDGSGNVYITGQTSSTSGIATATAYQTVEGDGGFYDDAFLAKFDGTGAIQWATYFGGDVDDIGTGVATDVSGNVFITGRTSSDIGIATSGAYLTSFGGGSYAVYLAEFNSAGGISWATYYGGISDDEGNAVATDVSGNVYVTGVTDGVSPITTTGCYQPIFGGGGVPYDAFLSKFDGTGALQWGTYYGGSGDDYGQGLATDASSNVYMVGYTNSTSAIATAYAYQPAFGGGFGDGDAFISEFNTSGGILYGSYYGGSGDEAAYGVTTNGSNVYMAGVTSSTSGIATAGAYQTLYGGGGFYGDAFLAQFVPCPIPVVAPIAGPSNICLGVPVTFTDDSTGGIWTSSHVVIASAGSVSGVVVGSATGVDTITYTVINACGDTTAVSQTVTVNSLPTVSAISSSAINVCVGASITLTDPTSGGAWGASNSSATVSAGLVTGASGGIDTIRYAVTNTCGTTTVSTNITVIAAPVVSSVSGSATVCAGSSVTFTDLTLSGTWSATNGTATVVPTGGAPSGFVTGVSAGVDTIDYSISNTCFTTTSSMAITVNPLPVIGAIGGGPANICIGTPTTYTDGTPPTGTWSMTNAVASITAGGTVTGASGGVDTILYSAASGGCSASASLSITVNAVASAGTISGPSIICIGSASSFTDAVAGGAWSVTNANATIDGGGSATGMALGMDTILYTATNACGTATDSFPVTITNTASAGTIFGFTNVCAGDSIYLFDITSGGVWSSSYGFATVSSTGSVTGVSAGVELISYTVTLPCGMATATYNVTVNPATSAGTISGPSPANVCIISPVTLSDGTTGGTWSVTNSTATVTTGTGLVTGVTPGIDTIQYTVTDACGSATAFFPITVETAPSAGIILGPSSVCVGSGIPLSDPVGGGSWSSVSPTVAGVGTSSGIVTGASAGTSLVSYTVTNSCGTAATTISITVIDFPDAGTISSIAILCPATTATLSDASAGGVWSSVTTGVATIDSATGLATGVSGGTTTISYTVTNMCGVAAATVLLTVNPSPSAGTISGATSVCIGASITLTETASGSGGTWSNTGADAAIAGGVLTGVSLGSTIVSYSVTNICGTANATHAVSIIGLPGAGAITGPLSVCVGISITLSDATTGGVWSSSTSLASVSGGVVTGVAGGIDNVSYTVTNVCGSTSAVYAVSVNTVPTSGTITGPTSICQDAGASLYDDIPGGVWSKSNNDALLDDAGSIAGITPGIDTIIYTVSNMCGVASISFPVIVYADSVCYPTGVKQTSAGVAALSVYPNPNSGSFTINLSSDISEDAHFIITNMVGEKVREFNSGTNQAVDVKLNTAAGVYFISAFSEHGRYMAKVTVE